MYDINKKGFTLIELLAIIILAIIALIVVPITINIIDDVKRESIEMGAKNYIDAVKLSISNKKMNDSTLNFNGVYEIINSGKQIKKDEIILDIPIEEALLKDGYIVMDNSKITKLSGVKVDNWNVKINNGIVELTKEDELERTLETGQQFNEKIKTLVMGENVQYKTEDTIVKSIEFYSYGILPNGYTNEKLQNLPNIDVSLNGDITAYNDNGKIYVCSENLLLINFFIITKMVIKTHILYRINMTSFTLYISIIAITRIPMGRYILTLIILVYIASILYVIKERQYFYFFC